MSLLESEPEYSSDGEVRAECPRCGMVVGDCTDVVTRIRTRRQRSIHLSSNVRCSLGFTGLAPWIGRIVRG